MILPVELIRNRETSLQLLTSSAGESREVAKWPGEGCAILSVFMLRGEGRLAGNGDPAHLLRSGYHILYHVPGETVVTIAPGSEGGFHAVAFQFSESYLQRHCPENCPDLRRLTNARPVASLQPLGHGMPVETGVAQRALVFRICDTGRPDHLRSVYRDIKIAELLVLQLEEMLYGAEGQARKDLKEGDGSKPAQNRATRLREYELQRVYQVRDMLRDHPGNTYTLLGLAREVGTNDATLKKHFKQVFGNTVFGYLRACRMETAKALLVEERKTVAEIAQYLGYKHVSHFSAAFRKHYGCAPTKLLAGR